jgi:hypothetical protein
MSISCECGTLHRVAAYRFYRAFAARKAGNGNDRGWKGWKAMKPLPALPTLFGNPFAIPTFPRPRRLDICLLVSLQFEPSPPQGAGRTRRLETAGHALATGEEMLKRNLLVLSLSFKLLSHVSPVLALLGLDPIRFFAGGRCGPK